MLDVYPLLETAEVALLAEGVDRNTTSTASTATMRSSPSSRRAWIEIVKPYSVRSWSAVALLAEGVDRNFAAHIQEAGKLCRPPRGGRG